MSISILVADSTRCLISLLHFSSMLFVYILNIANAKMSITSAYFPTINYSAAHLQEENDFLALYAYTQL